MNTTPAKRNVPAHGTPKGRSVWFVDVLSQTYAEETGAETVSEKVDWLEAEDDEQAAVVSPERRRSKEDFIALRAPPLL